MPRNKTDKFLRAIKKYARQQKSAMQDEVKQLKTERLNEAEKKGRLDSERLVKEKLNESRNRKTAVLAAKTQEANREVLLERSAMVDEVFAMAADKLLEYAKTADYAEKLEKSAAEIAELFGENACVLYLCERDLGFAGKIKSHFGGSAEIAADKTIRLGGLKGYCAKMGIIADETLDSKLEEQREWFIENAALTV